MTSAKTAVEVRPALASVRFGRHRDHLAWMGLGATALLVTALYAQRTGHRGAFVTGALAGALFLAGFVFALRRRLGVKPFTRVRPFYLAHVWLSSAGLGVALLHAGRFPLGRVGTALLLGVGLAVGSGFLLTLVHALFKRSMAAIEDEALLPEDILESRERHAREMADLFAASGPALALKLRTDVLRPLSRLHVLRAALGGRPALARLRLGTEQRTLAGSSLPTAEQAVLRRAITVRVEHLELELESTLHRIREGCVTLHVVLAAGTLGFLVLHVVLVLAF